MSAEAIRVLGIDTSLRSTGVGVVEARGNAMAALELGTLRVGPKVPLSECLVRIRDGLDALIERFTPAAAAIEGAFFCKNARTAMILGQARGVAIAACAARRLPVYEYAPRRVKQAVVGYGAASKEQVQSMIASLLNLPEKPPADPGDALALAVCHLHCRTRHDLLSVEPI
jgi:crossover junction endodeoxyribonuclease RuvC